MGDPPSGLFPPADSRVDSLCTPFLLAGIRPFLQAPPPRALPDPATLAFSLPVAPHAEAQGQTPFPLGTDRLSNQVSPLSTGQPPCLSSVPFAPTAVVPLSGQSTPLP